MAWDHLFVLAWPLRSGGPCTLSRAAPCGTLQRRRTLSLPKTPLAFNSGQLLATLTRPAHNRCGPQRSHAGREVTVTSAQIERIQDGSIG
jgi:hypothetical protein